MPKSNKALITFSGGEWDPALDARQDLEKAASASRTCRNMVIDRYGGVFRRPGLRFIAETKPFWILFSQNYLTVGFGDNSSGNWTLLSQN